MLKLPALSLVMLFLLQLSCNAQDIQPGFIQMLKSQRNAALDNYAACDSYVGQLRLQVEKMEKELDELKRAKESPKGGEK